MDTRTQSGAGKHEQKHLRHALKFKGSRAYRDRHDREWKDSGVVACILPASAFYDGHLEEFGVHDRRGDTYGKWRDLPVASFAESGTNVPTGYIIL